MAWFRRRFRQLHNVFQVWRSLGVRGHAGGIMGPGLMVGGLLGGAAGALAAFVIGTTGVLSGGLFPLIGTGTLVTVAVTSVVVAAFFVAVYKEKFQSNKQNYIETIASSAKTILAVLTPKETRQKVQQALNAGAPEVAQADEATYNNWKALFNHTTRHSHEHIVQNYLEKTCGTDHKNRLPPIVELKNIENLLAKVISSGDQAGEEGNNNIAKVREIKASLLIILGYLEIQRETAQEAHKASKRNLGKLFRFATKSTFVTECEKAIDNIYNEYAALEDTNRAALIAQAKEQYNNFKQKPEIAEILDLADPSKAASLCEPVSLVAPAA